MEQRKSFRDYIIPSSSTWWAGVVLIVSGIIQQSAGVVPYWEFVDLFVEAYLGSTDPVTKIAIGMGFIGVRRKQGETIGAVP